MARGSLHHLRMMLVPKYTRNALLGPSPMKVISNLLSYNAWLGDPLQMTIIPL